MQEPGSKFLITMLYYKTKCFNLLNYSIWLLYKTLLRYEETCKLAQAFKLLSPRQIKNTSKSQMRKTKQNCTEDFSNT